MLRQSVSGDLSQPIKGLNLRDPANELSSGEVVKLQNLYWDGFIRLIPGTVAWTANISSPNAYIRGGIRFYSIVDTPRRLVAFSNALVEVDDAGAATLIGGLNGTTGNVYFSSWSITNSCYISDGEGLLTVYSGVLAATISGTNIPITQGPVVPILDRLLGITDDGIERTDARVDNVWSSNSSWATFRPARPGKFTALHSYSLKGTDSIYPGALAFQQNAYYHITGTDFGTDVTSSTASNDENASITMIEPTVGTSSPMSIVTIPGVGVAWFTSDRNVYWIPEGQLSGKFVGDKLLSNGTTQGLESVNIEALDKVWMTHYDRKLILGVPLGSSLTVNTQFWLDLRTLTSAVDDPIVPWYGPMTADTWGCVWREDQQGELRLMAGEGKTSVGGYLYNTYQPQTATHMQGATEILPVCIYQDRHNSFKHGQQSKHIQDFRLTAHKSGGNLRAGVLDLQSEAVLLQAVEVYSE